MRKNITRRQVAASIALLAAIAGGSAASASEPALIAAAEAEGQLVIYGDLFTVPKLVAGFSAKYPKIRVTSATGDAWQIYNRFVSENASGRPLLDVFYQAEDTIITAQEAGTLAEYISSEAANLEALATPSTAGKYYVRGNGQINIFAYNKDGMDKKALPKDWTDYANPPAEWDGLVATTNPASSSATFATIAGLYQSYGPDKGGEILRGLRKVKTELTASMGVMTTKLQTGERPLDFFNNSNAASGLINQGVPVQIVIPASGAFAQFNAIAISKTAPHPNAARLFADYVLGEDAQKMLASNSVYSLRKGVAPPKNLPAMSEVKLMNLDLPQALKDRETILKWWSTNTGFNFR